MSTSNNKTSAFFGFDERVHAYIKHEKKEQKKFYTYYKYWDCVSKYKEFAKLDFNYLDYPILNYRIYDKGLYRRYDNTINLLKNIKESFGLTIHSENFKLEKRLVKRLYVYLKVFTPKTDNTFDGIKDYYLFKYYPIELSINFLTHFTYQYFAISDENLCFINLSPYCIDINLSKLLIVDYKVSKEIFTFFDMPTPSTSVQRKLFALLKKDLSFKLPDKKRLLPLYDKLPILNLDDYPGIINYKLNIDSTKYKKGNYYLNYDTSYGMYTVTLSRFLFKEFTNYSSLNRIIDINQVPSNIATYLHSITGGNYDCLNSIACLVADLLTHKNIQKKLNVIYSQSKLFPMLQKFIDIISFGRCANIPLPMNQLLGKNAISQLINLKNNSKIAIVIDNYSDQTTSKSYAVFKKIIAGKPISYDDAFSGKINYINNLALIRVTEDSKEINDYKNNNLKINLINLLSVSSLPSLEFSDEDINWLLLPFALYGLNVINGRSTISPLNQQKDIPGDTTIVEFFNNFCDISSSAKETGKKLYENYVKYYTKYYGDNHLSSILFTKELKKYLQNNHIDFMYGQFSHTKSSNERTFKGFSFDENKFNKFLCEYNEKKPSTDFQDFVQYLQQMNKLVPKELIL